MTPRGSPITALSWRAALALGGGLMLAQALLLLAMGQPAICPCGTIELWNGEVLSAKNSQQLTDWYSFTHIIHGFLFYLLFRLAAPSFSPGTRFLLAMAAEVGWELIENSPVIIERYRQTALALGYSGDSVVNSLADSVMAACGFLLAWRLPASWIVALAIAMELFVGYEIRDNLTLNIIQLIHPSAALSRWQAGG